MLKYSLLSFLLIPALWSQTAVPAPTWVIDWQAIIRQGWDVFYALVWWLILYGGVGSW